MGGYSWIFWLLGAVAIVLGLVPLTRGRWRDSERGTRRCPKCWYSMASVPSLQCPECGNEAGEEMALFQIRRRMRARLLGLVVVLLGAALLFVPTVTKNGIYAALPTTVLLALEPLLHEDQWVDPMSPGGAWTATSPIAKEMSRRGAAGKLSTWQWRFYLDRARLVKVRPVWPRGMPLTYRYRMPSWVARAPMPAGARGGFSYETYQVSVNPWQSTAIDRNSPQATGVTSAGARDPKFFASLGVPDEGGRANYYALATGSDYSNGQFKETLSVRRSCSIRTRLVDTPEEAIASDTAPELTEKVRYEALALICFRPETHVAEVAPRLQLRTNGSSLPLDRAFGMHVDVMRDGHLVASGTLVTVRDRVFFDRYSHIELSRWLFEDYKQDSRLSRWYVVLRGDAAASLPDLDHGTYWKGETVVPLKFVP